MFIKKLLKPLSIIFCLSMIVSMLAVATPINAVAEEQAGSVYYVDSQNGSDSNNGTSSNSAWQSLDKINATTFLPGDTILLKRGSVWNGFLFPKGSGTTRNRITLDAYGTGSLPLINGNGKAYVDASDPIDAAVYFDNQSNWTVRNLEVTNFVPGDTTLTQVGNISGIHFDATAYDCRGITVENCSVHHIASNGNATLHASISAILVNSSAFPPKRFEDITVVNNVIYTTGSTAIYVNGSKGLKTAYGHYIANNYLYDIGGDGIMTVGSTDAVIEYNICASSHVRSTAYCVAFWPFASDGAVFQYNEAYGTVTTKDGQGLDCDYKCNGTVFQYNYAHHNEGGFMLICCEPGTANYNNDITIRYNIGSHNPGTQFSVFGQLRNTYIYNNTLYIPAGTSCNIVSEGARDGTSYADNTNFWNNIIMSEGIGKYNIGNCTNTTFDYNVFYGYHDATEPADAHKITANPLLAGPEIAGNGWNNIDYFKLTTGSPALGSGMVISNNGGKDIWGNPVSATAAPNRGAYNGNAAATTSTKYEFEDLAKTSSGGTVSNGADAGASNSLRSNFNATGVGSYVEYTVPNVAPGTYSITLSVKRFSNQGQFSLSVGSQNVGSIIDNYAKNTQYYEINAGTVTITQSGDQQFGFTCVGKNDLATGYYGIFDWVKLTEISNPPTWTQQYNPIDRTASPIYTYFECESVASVASGASKQVTADAGANGNQTLVFYGNSLDDYVEFTLPYVAAGTYQVMVNAKDNAGRGIFTVSANGTNAGSFDCYGTTNKYLDYDAGNVTFTQSGSQTIRLTATGKNDSATGYNGIFDYILLLDHTAPPTTTAATTTTQAATEATTQSSTQPTTDPVTPPVQTERTYSGALSNWISVSSNSASLRYPAFYKSGVSFTDGYAFDSAQRAPSTTYDHGLWTCGSGTAQTSTNTLAVPGTADATNAEGNYVNLRWTADGTNATTANNTQFLENGALNSDGFSVWMSNLSATSTNVQVSFGAFLSTSRWYLVRTTKEYTVPAGGGWVDVAWNDFVITYAAAGAAAAENVIGHTLGGDDINFSNSTINANLRTAAQRIQKIDFIRMYVDTAGAGEPAILLDDVRMYYDPDTPADTTPPVITIGSYNTDPTNQDITVTATTNEGTLNATSHTFTANGSYTFTANDAAGNTSSQTVTITNIDKTAPVITIGSYNTDPTNQDITVTASANEGTLNATSYTFTANGSYTFTATDVAGNSSSYAVIITNIDKTAPVITIAPYNSTDPLTSVTVTATTNEGTLNETSHTFTANGSFTFTATDAAGNTSSSTVTITNITPTVITNECETMTKTLSSSNSNYYNGSDPSASGGVCNVFNSSAIGEYIEYTMPNVTAGTYKVSLRVKKGNNRGMYQASISSTNVGSELDFYAQSSSYATYELGNVTFTSSGDQVIRLTCTGKNSLGTSYSGGFDCVILEVQ